MLVIPAIDLKGGNCVRLFKGKFNQETIYSKDPLTIAELWYQQGARRIHIVDLDGAFSGGMENNDIIYKIVKKTDVPIQVGGGIRDYETVRELIDNGVSKVILGTSAVKNLELVKKAVSSWPNKIIVGIDSSAGKVAIDGWQEITNRPATELASQMEALGVGEIIVTDIEKDGTLEGPSYKWIEKIARAVNISVIASGGVATLEDIKKFKDLKLDNLTGVIVGKALYSENFKLDEAIKVALK